MCEHGLVRLYTGQEVFGCGVLLHHRVEEDIQPGSHREGVGHLLMLRGKINDWSHKSNGVRGIMCEVILVILEKNWGLKLTCLHLAEVVNHCSQV